MIKPDEPSRAEPPLDSFNWPSSPAYKLARLRDRLMDRTLDEVRRWVLNTNKPTRVPQSWS